MSRELRKVEMAEQLARRLWPTFARERTSLYRELMAMPAQEVKRRYESADGLGNNAGHVIRVEDRKATNGQAGPKSLSNLFRF